jgi:bifunctional DNA-binding transcriptional regulator/antitoxin component of YhaV-PrlF toxin-antitoxin module
MDEFIRKVYERGKVTIPKELRDLYGVNDGDLVKLRIVKVIQAMEEGRKVQREQEIEVDLRVGDDETPTNGASRNQNGRQ